MVQKLIDQLDDNFRGLWRAHHLTNSLEGYWRWYVTFEYKGDLVETDGSATPEGALTSAIEIIERHDPATCDIIGCTKCTEVAAEDVCPACHGDGRSQMNQRVCDICHGLPYDPAGDR